MVIFGDDKNYWWILKGQEDFSWKWVGGF